MSTPVRPRIDHSRYARSTGMVVTGVLLLVAGGASAVMGSQAAISSSMSLYGSRDAGSGFFIFAALAGFVGLIVLVMGLSQMTTNIDLTAQYVAEVMRRQETGDDPASTAGEAGGGGE